MTSAFIAWRRRVVLAVGPALALAICASCGRVEDEPWKVEERAPPLTDGLTFSPPPEDRMLLRRQLAAGMQTDYALRLDHQVRARGHLMPAVATRVTDQMTLRESVLSGDPDRLDVMLSVESAEVSIEPTAERTEDDREAAFLDTSLRTVVGRSGALGRLEASNLPGEKPRADLTTLEREVEEAVRLLLPILPADAVHVGDSWPLEREIARQLPGEGTERVRQRGMYHFRGMVDWEDRVLAAVDLDYRVTVWGSSSVDGVSGTITGDGIGRAVYLVDPTSGTTMRSQAVETTRLVMALATEKRRTTGEQYARLTYDLSLMEEAQ